LSDVSQHGFLSALGGPILGRETSRSNALCGHHDSAQPPFHGIRRQNRLTYNDNDYAKNVIVAAEEIMPLSLSDFDAITSYVT